MLFYVSPVVPEKRFEKDEIRRIREQVGLSRLTIFRLQRGATIKLKDGTVVTGVKGMRSYLGTRRIRLPVHDQLKRIIKKPTLRERLAARRRPK